MIKVVPREMPMAQGPGQAVCGLGMLPSEDGQTRDTPLQPKTSRLIRWLWSKEEPVVGGQLCREDRISGTLLFEGSPARKTKPGEEGSPQSTQSQPHFSTEAP